MGERSEHTHLQSLDIWSEADIRQRLETLCPTIKLRVMSHNRNPQRRQRWMLYPIYVTAALLCVHSLFFFATLKETREFIGKKGVEYCWAYGSFERYLFSHLTSILIIVVGLSLLYWLARRDYMVAYLVIWATWLLGNMFVSFFDLSFC